MLEVGLQNLCQIVLIHRAGEKDLECISEERHRVVVVYEEGILRENLALGGLLYVPLERQQAILLGCLEELVRA